MSSPSQPDAGPERLLTGQSGRMALLLALGWMAILLGRQAVPPLLPTIIVQLHITPSRAGFALTVLMGLYAVLQYPAGRLSDVLSRTTVLVASIGGLVAGFVLLGTVETYARLLVGAAVVGISSAFYFTPSRALLSDLFVRRRGQALGLQTTAGMAGSALAAGLAVASLRFATWQAAFLPSVVLLACVVLLLHRWSHEPYVLRNGGLDLNPTGTVTRLVSSPGLRRLLGMRAISSFIFQGIVGFLPAFLQFEKGFSAPVASTVYALVFVTGAMTGPLAGRLSDQVDRLRVALAGVGIALLGLGLLLVTTRLVPLVLAIVLVSTGLVSHFPVMQAYLMDRFPDDSVGGDYGAAKTVFSGLGSLGPTYLGVLVTFAGYTAAFATLLPFLVLAGALLVTSQQNE